MANIKPFHITKKFEHKKFVQFQESLTKKRSSYSSFIITSDKKMVLCKRSSSFYFSHMTSVFKRLLRNEKILKDYMVKIILSYIAHFKVYELITFLIWVDSIYNIFTDISLPEYQLLKNGIDHISLQFLDNRVLLLIGQPEFISSLKEVASSFTRSLFRGDINEFSYINNDPIYVLPGGRRSSSDSDNKETLFREIKEEIGYDMYSNDIKMVSDDFSIRDKNKDIAPVLVCTTTDKVFNRYFVEYISIILIPNTAQDIIDSFIPNKEVSDILLLDVSNEIDTMFSDRTLTPLLHVFKKI